MKHRLTCIIANTLVVGMAVSLWMVFSDGIPAGHQDILVSVGLTLTTQWQELRPETVMQTSAPWSELLREVPRFRLHLHYADDGMALADGTHLACMALLLLI